MVHELEEQPRPDIATALKTVTALALIGGLFVIQFIVHWDYPVSDPAALLLIVCFVMIGGIFGLLSFAGQLMCLLVCLVGALVMFAYSGVIRELTLLLAKLLIDLPVDLGFGARGFAILSLSTVLCLSSFVLLLGFIALKSHGSSLLLVFATATLVATILLPGQISGLFRTEGRLPPQRAALPPFVLIVLDMQMGPGGFPAELPGVAAARAALLDSYSDFQIFEAAYSRYAYTGLSLPAAFNFTKFGEPLKVSLGGLNPVQYRMTENRLFGLLKARGYAIEVIQSVHMDLCTGLADKCVTQPTDQLARLADTKLPVFDRMFVLARLLTYALFRAGPRNHYSFSAESMIAEAMDELERNSRGLALILHIMIPHRPFVYDKNCKITDPRGWQTGSRQRRYQSYLDQVVCTTKKVARLFEILRKQGYWQEATVILLGDHGTRITSTAPGVSSQNKAEGTHTPNDRDMVDLFSVLFAIKRPDLTPGRRSRPVEMQNALAYFLGQRKKLYDSDSLSRSLVGPRYRRPIGAGFRPITLPDLFQHRSNQ